MVDMSPAAPPGHTSRGWAPATRAYWLERFYDLVFVACVGRFASELGTAPSLARTVTVLGWLAGLWMSWFLVTTRMNRFPDEGLATRLALVFQLLALTVAAAAAVSITTTDDLLGVVAVASTAAGVAVLYATIPRMAGADRTLVRAQVAGNLVVAAAVASVLVLPRAVGVAVSTGVATAWLCVVLGWYLPRVARGRPVDPRHAGDRYGQLYLVLTGLSFLKIAFEPDPRGGVDLPVVLGGFAVGFALWSLYVDGVLPLGFPLAPVRQRRWLIAQLALALGVTVAAAAVVAVPPSDTGSVTVPQAVLEGGAFAVVLLALALLARTSQQPSQGSAVARGAGAAAVLAASVVAGVTGRVPDPVFSLVVALLLVLTACVDPWARRRGADPA